MGMMMRLFALFVATAAATRVCYKNAEVCTDNGNDCIEVTNKTCAEGYEVGNEILWHYECCREEFGFMEVVWLLVGLSQATAVVVLIYLSKTTEVTGYRGQANPHNGQPYPGCCALWCCTPCAISSWEAGESCGCCATPNAKTACCICLMLGTLASSAFGVFVWQPVPLVGEPVKAEATKAAEVPVANVTLVTQPPVAPVGVEAGAEAKV